MAKKKKLKIKKQVIYFILIVFALIVGTILGIHYWNDYQYKQTNEYKLLSKGYTKEETELLFQKLTEEKIQELLEQEKNETLLAILNEKYYLSKNLDAYLEYQKRNTNTSTYDIVALINTGAHQDWYENIVDADTSLGNLLLVNKFHQLANDYSPENLIKVSKQHSYGEQQITKEAYEGFQNMFNKAKEENVTFFINSSYRNYKDQEDTYNSLKKAYGSSKADSQAARPGHSEHETALAFDIFTPGNTSTGNFKDSKAYEWLKENAQDYGFIERYPEGKEYLTGYNYEAWHWRYVGIEVAKQIKEEEITFDEYYAFYIEQ